MEQAPRSEPKTSFQMRPLNQGETKVFFEKLAKYIGDNIPKLLQDKTNPHVFRLIKDRVFYISLNLANSVGSIPRKSIVSAGICMGKFQHSGKFRLAVTALPVIAPYAKNRVWVTPGAELSFMYRHDIIKSGLVRVTDGIPQYSGVVVFNNSDQPIGFGVSARSTGDAAEAEPQKTIIIHEADVGEWLRDEASVI